MTAATGHSESLRGTPVTQAFLATLGVAVLTMLAASWTQLADPFVRHDDFPALLGRPEEFYIKTLAEGRWLNYWWIKRSVLWSHQVNYVLYQLGWAAFAAAFATNALGPSARPIWRGALAAMVVLAPQALSISQWYNTLIPGVWLLAIYALLCGYLSFRRSALLLLVFSPLVFSAYTTYPFVLLATLLARHDVERSARTYVATTVVFAISFALALGMAYGLNWVYHGTFGIEVGDWREPNPAESWADMAENLPLISQFVVLLVHDYGLGHFEFGLLFLALFAGAFYAVFLTNKREALFIVTPIVLGLGLLCVHSLTTGVSFPVRSTVFMWLGATYCLVRSGMLSGATGLGRAVSILIMAAFILYLGYHVTRNQVVKFTRWQAATARIAAEIPGDVDVIHVIGDRRGIDGAGIAGIQSNDGLTARLTYLTGIPAVYCYDKRESCKGVLSPSAEGEISEPTVQRADGGAILFLPTGGGDPKSAETR